GSNFGIGSAGRYSLWIALPVVVDYFFSITSLSAKTSFTVLNKQHQLSTIISGFNITEKQFVSIRIWFTYTCIILFLSIAVSYTWNDSRNRTKMVYQIDNNFMKGIFTTKQKAD